MIINFRTLGGAISTLTSFSKNQDFQIQTTSSSKKPWPRKSSPKEEHQISLSKILPSWHHPQKTGAWNENKKYG